MNGKNVTITLLATALLVGACSGSASVAVQPTPTVEGEKFDMPHDFPAVVTTCIHGTRVFQTFSYKIDSARASTGLALAVVPSDPTCQVRP